MVHAHDQIADGGRYVVPNAGEQRPQRAADKAQQSRCRAQRQRAAAPRRTHQTDKGVLRLCAGKVQQLPKRIVHSAGGQLFARRRHCRLVLAALQLHHKFLRHADDGRRLFGAAADLVEFFLSDKRHVILFHRRGDGRLPGWFHPVISLLHRRECPCFLFKGPNAAKKAPRAVSCALPAPFAGRLPGRAGAGILFLFCLMCGVLR